MHRTCTLSKVHGEEGLGHHLFLGRMNGMSLSDDQKETLLHARRSFDTINLVGTNVLALGMALSVSELWAHGISQFISNSLGGLLWAPTKKSLSTLSFCYPVFILSRLSPLIQHIAGVEFPRQFSGSEERSLNHGWFVMGSPYWSLRMCFTPMVPRVGKWGKIRVLPSSVHQGKTFGNRWRRKEAFRYKSVSENVLFF